ncbi:MAG TPA: hypothetical protein VF198_11270 [Vicinamibacterales bacterium]
MQYELRPLSIPELLDRIFTLYRRHFVLFAGLMAAPIVAMTIAMLPFQLLQPAIMNAPDSADVLILALIPAMLLGTLLFWILYTIAIGAGTLAVSQIYRGAPVTIRSAYRDVLPQTPRLLLLMLLIGLRALGFFVLLGAAGAGVAAAVGGIGALIGDTAGAVVSVLLALLLAGSFFAGFVVIFFLLLRYALAVSALVIENLGANAAIARSVALSRGHMLPLFLVVLCSTLVGYGVGLLFQAPLMMAGMVVGPDSPFFLPFTIGASVLGAVGSIVTAPFVIIGLAVVYFDVRIRREALDVQMMLRALDAGGVPPGLTPAPGPGL